MAGTKNGEPLEGHCLCGAVRMRAALADSHVDACHCTMCRRWGGIAFVGVQAEGEVAIEGEEHVARYRSSAWAERGFCSRCGTHLFYRFVAEDRYSFPAGLLPDDALQPLREEIFIDQKPAYYAFGGDSETLTGAQAQERYGFG